MTLWITDSLRSQSHVNRAFTLLDKKHSCVIFYNSAQTVTNWMNPSVLLTDRDECDETNGVLHNCHEDAICENTVGSFRCQCNVGYRTTQDYDQGTECEGTANFHLILSCSTIIDCKTITYLVT